MLTMTEVRVYVAQVHYKPGWSFHIVETDFESPQIEIIARVMDAYDRSKTVDLGIRSFLPPFRDYEALRDWLMWRIIRIESHEAREFFQVGAERPFDPHAEEAGNARTSA